MKNSKSLKNLQLKKEVISNLNANKIKGGIVREGDDPTETKPVGPCLSHFACTFVNC